MLGLAEDQPPATGQEKGTGDGSRSPFGAGELLNTIAECSSLFSLFIKGSFRALSIFPCLHDEQAVPSGSLVKILKTEN